MDTSAGNAIKKARLARNMSREDLAGRIGYSEDTVRAWEVGARAAPLEALSKMQLVLDSDWLAVIYLSEKYEALRAALPQFEVGKPLAQAAAGYVTCILDLVDQKIDRKLLRLVADGQIDAVEKETFDAILELAAAANKAYYEMVFAAGAAG